MYSLKQNSLTDYRLFFICGSIFYVTTIVIVLSIGYKYGLITGNISAWALVFGMRKFEKTKELELRNG